MDAALQKKVYCNISQDMRYRN